MHNSVSHYLAPNLRPEVSNCLAGDKVAVYSGVIGFDDLGLMNVFLCHSILSLGDFDTNHAESMQW